MEEEEQNPRNSLFINPLEGYNEERQKRIDQGAQFVDKVVTGGLEKINMPGSEFIGDRARNVAGFTADMLIPEDWEIPIIGAAAAMPLDGPLGEAAIYGGGVVNRVRRAAKGVNRATLANLSNIVDDAFSSANSLFNRGQPGWRVATANGADVSQELAEQSAQPMRMTGSGGSIKQQVLEDRLNDPRIEKFLTGQGTLRSKELSNLVQEFADRDDFMSVVSSRLDQLKEKYPNLVRQLDNQKETIALRWHHVNPSKGPIDLYIGLTAPADRSILRNHLVDKLGVFSGNHPLNNRGLSIDVHDQIHDWLGTRIGLRADVLKHKWAQKMGIDVGDLQPGIGFMANHLTLCKEGKAAFDAWFSTLKPHERLPFIEEYGKIIKESEGILGDLMTQYDSLFAVPEGFRLTPDNEVLLRFLDSIPTDGSKLLQKDMKAIVEQVNREMPRGTLDLVQTSTGRVTQLNLDDDLYKRIQEVKLELDKATNRRTINSLTKELKNLEKGILQKSLDIEGAVKQGKWAKRLEQEKLRREGK